MKDMDPWEMRNEVSPTIALVYNLENIPRPSSGRRNPGNLEDSLN